MQQTSKICSFFPKIDRDEILEKTTKIKISKTCQDAVIPTKVIERISDYPTTQNTANVTPVLKNGK